MPAADSPMIVGDVHAYYVPPQLATSSRQVTPATISAEPR